MRAAVVDSTGASPSTVALRSDGLLLRSVGATFRAVPNGRVPIRATMNAVVVWRFPSGECAVNAGTAEGLAVRRTCGGESRWHTITERVMPGLLGNEITAVSTLPGDRLAVGTNRGLVILQVGQSFDAAAVVVTSMTDADGLPHPFLNAIGPIDGQQRLWVGTTLGAGFVNMGSLDRRGPPPALLALDIRDENGDVVSADHRIPSKALVALFLPVDRLRTRSARRRAADAEANERRLATSEERFRRLFSDGFNPQLLILDGAVWQANAAAVALLVSAEVPIVARAVSALIPAIDNGLSTTAPASWRRELHGCGPRGDMIPLEVCRTRIPINDGALDHLELLDLRERKRLEQERRDLQVHVRNTQRLEAVGTLAGGVAHDFNNLLTVIHSNAELAMADVSPKTSAAGALEQLLIASRRAREGSCARSSRSAGRRRPSTATSAWSCCSTRCNR